MNKDNAHEYLPLVQALADGKTIQHPSGANSWRDYPYDTNLTFELDARFYRVKPEPRTFELLICVESYSSFVVGDIRVGPLPIDRNSQWKRITVREVLEARTLKPES